MSKEVETDSERARLIDSIKTRKEFVIVGAKTMAFPFLIRLNRSKAFEALAELSEQLELKATLGEKAEAEPEIELKMDVGQHPLKDGPLMILTFEKVEDDLAWFFSPQTPLESLRRIHQAVWESPKYNLQRCAASLSWDVKEVAGQDNPLAFNKMTLGLKSEGERFYLELTDESFPKGKGLRARLPEVYWEGKLSKIVFQVYLDLFVKNFISLDFSVQRPSFW